MYVLEDVCEPIFTPEDDVDFGAGTSQDGKCLHSCSATTCDNPAPGSFPARKQISDITSYIKGSMVYGSSTPVAKVV